MSDAVATTTATEPETVADPLKIPVSGAMRLMILKGDVLLPAVSTFPALASQHRCSVGSATR